MTNDRKWQVGAIIWLLTVLTVAWLVVTLSGCTVVNVDRRQQSDGLRLAQASVPSKPVTPTPYCDWIGLTNGLTDPDGNAWAGVMISWTNFVPGELLTVQVCTNLIGSWQSVTTMPFQVGLHWFKSPYENPSAEFYRLTVSR